MQGDRRIIFVGGVHGVGKTHFSSSVTAALAFSSYSASDLIRKYKQAPADQQKRVADINQNQTALLSAIELYTPPNSRFLLDGHFCLLDSAGLVQRVPVDVFEMLQLRGIILLRDDPLLISERRHARDRHSMPPEFIAQFQINEELAAKDASVCTGVPLLVTAPNLTDDTLEFIRTKLA